MFTILSEAELAKIHELVRRLEHKGLPHESQQFLDIVDPDGQFAIQTALEDLGCYIVSLEMISRPGEICGAGRVSDRTSSRAS